MMFQSRWLRVAAVSSLITFGLVVLSAWLLNSQSYRVVKQWHQPNEIKYKSFDPYTLSVIENTWSFPRRHYLFIGRGDDAPSYGHYLDYSFHPGGDDIDAHIALSTVEWDPDGLTFVEASGHRLIVPKNMFVGGR